MIKIVLRIIISSRDILVIDKNITLYLKHTDHLIKYN